MILLMKLEVLEVAAVAVFIEPEIFHQCGLEMAAATREGLLMMPLGFKGNHYREHLFKNFVGGNQRRPRGQRLQGQQL